MDSPVAVASISAFAGVVAATLVFLSARRANAVNAQANTLKWAETLRADAADARREAAEARREATEAHKQMAAIRQEAEKLVAELRLIRRTAWREDMTMPAFREFLAGRSAPME